MNLKDRVNELYNSQKQYGLLMLDPLYFEDVKWFIINKQDIEQIIFENYFPSNKLTLSMPKGNFSFRPVSFILPIDTLIYYAIVDKILFRKRNWISKYVYSHIRESSHRQVFNNPVMHWNQMRKELLAAARSDIENSIMINCDISGFYENVKIDRLLLEIDFFCGVNEKNYKTKLKSLLDKWKYAMSQGLLQPSHASDLLAKYYLNSVDLTFNFLGRKYARYVDEFYIIENNEKNLIRRTLDLNENLRELGLNLNNRKTKTYRGEEILYELESNSFFRAVDYAINMNDFNLLDTTVVEKIKEMYEKIGRNEEINDSEFRRCTRILKNKKVPEAINLCLEMLKTHPQQTVDIIQYLSYFVNDDIALTNSLISSIEDQSINHYYWQNYWILLCLMNLTNLPENLQILCDNIFKNKNQNELVRCAAFLLLAKHITPPQLKHYEEYLSSEASIFIKRVILVGFTRLPKDYTLTFYTHEDKEDISLYITKEYCKYLQENEKQIVLPNIMHM